MTTPDDPNLPGWGAPPPQPTPPPSSGYTWQQQGPPLGGPMSPPPATGTNGLAIASFVCAITLFWACGLGIILGLVFGFVALSQIKRTGQSGRGFAIAGIVISCVTIFLVVVGVILVAVFSDDLSDQAAEEARDVEVVSCSRNEFGQLRAELAVTNHSSKTSDYDITIEFVTPDSDQDRVAVGDTELDGLAPNQTRRIEVVASADNAPETIGCFKFVDRTED